MKVLMLTRQKEWGAGEHTLKLCKYLRKNNIEVDEVYGKGDVRTNLMILGIDLSNYDILHVQGSPFCMFGVKIPKVTTVHSLLQTELEYQKSLKFKIGVRFENLTLNSSDSIIVVNDFMKEELKKYGDFKDINVMYNSIDFDEFDGIYYDKDDYILIGGRDIPRKNFEEVRNICEKANLKLIEFGTNNYVSREKLLDLYNHARMFISASLYETGCLTALEATASRCPVIIRTAEYNNRFLSPFKYSNVEELARSIVYVYNLYLNDTGRDFLMKATKENYDYIKKMYSWDKTVKDVVDIYNRLLA